MHHRLALLLLFLLISHNNIILVVAAAGIGEDGGGGMRHHPHGGGRMRRQLEEPSAGRPAQQIDLNITVPFVFSARLYPFGPKNGDTELAGDGKISEFRPAWPLLFFGQSFDKFWIHENGLVTFSPDFDGTSPVSLPIKGGGAPLIAPFWTEKAIQLGQGRRVFVRESTDENTLGLAQNEVNIQFRYGNGFEPESVVVITWEEAAEHDGQQQQQVPLFQLALILGKNACFAHAVYSKVQANSAIVGFNGPVILKAEEGEGVDASNEAEEKEEEGNNAASYFAFPGSGTPAAGQQMAEKSNIGIPGEWLVRMDEERIFLCGAGFQGLECVDSCLPNQWYLDCSRSCHCADGLACNVESGECPDAKCSPGWQGAPICDEDIDECAQQEQQEGKRTTPICPDEQPDCMNTPGAFLCFCLDYDNSTGSCTGPPPSSSSGEKSAAPSALAERIPVPIASLSLIPQLGPSPSRNRPSPIAGKHQQNGFAGGAAIPVPGTAATITIRPFFGGPSPPRLPPPSLPSVPDPRHPPPPPPPTLPSLNSPNSEERDEEEGECGGGGGRGFKCADENAVCRQGRCQCADGWTTRGKGGNVDDGQECVDMDECAMNSTVCGRNAECQNLVGSYQCICNAGFVASQSGQGCLDVDECSQADGAAVVCPQANAMCLNTIGGFLCQCAPGFSGDPMTATEGGGGCADIDECQTADYYCGKHANCTNLAGSFRCDCHPGFERMPNSVQCQDVDECSGPREQLPCHQAATCTNMEGAFHCECIEGFIGDGRQCHESVLFPVPSLSNQPRPIIGPTAAPIPVQFGPPLLLFGRPFSSLLVSPNGLLLFGNQSLFLMAPPAPPPPNSLVPLLANFDPTGGGSIGTFQMDEDIDLPTSSKWRGLLSRATMLVKNDFRVADFRVERLFIATFERMTTTANPGKWNTFQVALVQGSQRSSAAPLALQSATSNTKTFAIFLYNELAQQPTAGAMLSGIAHPRRGFLSIPVELLLTGSNVGQPGKWIFRVDSADKVFACPSGTLGPPLCQQECNPGQWGFDCAEQCKCADQLPCDFGSGHCPGGKCAPGFTGPSCAEDVDECAIGAHRCAEHAICTNLVGSYSCQCNSPKFHGDGFNCTMLDPCLMRFNANCNENAHCDVSNEQMPECVCNEGFHGDGRRECRPNVLTSTTGKPSSSTSSAKTTTSTIQAASKTKQQLTRMSTIVMMTSPAEMNERRRNGGEQQNGKERGAKTNGDNNNEQQLISAVSDSGTLVLVVCSVLGATWLLVALLFTLIYCFRKHRNRTMQRSEYSPQMLGWAPTRTLNGGLRRTGGTNGGGPRSSHLLASTKFTIS